jgi:sulfotransferase family protein
MEREPATKKRQRPPVLVIGAHRSGTTATARCLELLGLQLGHRLDSHHEPKSLQRVHDYFLAQTSSAWHRPEPFLEYVKTAEGKQRCIEYLRTHAERDFARTFGYRKNLRGLWLLARQRFGAHWGWKEPRTTLFAEGWLEVFPEARIVHVIRHPLAVALSIRRREMRFRDSGDLPKGRLDDLDYCLRLALTYIEVGQHVSALTPRYYSLRFEDLQSKPRETLSTMAAFCGLTPTEAQLEEAAREIRPPSLLSESSELAPDSVRTLLENYPGVGRLGYS